MRFMRKFCQPAVLLLSIVLAGCGRPSALTTARLVQPIVGLPAGTDGFPWWNDTVFYEIFVRSYFDSNGDGIGDLRGLVAKLDYLNDGDAATSEDLGVTGLWLMPIHPSPSYHGYDVTDYYAINPEYGTMEDFQQLLREAHRRGVRVLIDLVLNHTSSGHPWFLAAQDPSSAKRDWYIWSEENPGYLGPWGQTVWHPSTSGHYYGLFWEGMPDLNYTNPEVTAQMQDVVRFWLQDVGVDGFRLDAARHLIEDGQLQTNSEATHTWYKTFRPYYKSLNQQALTVGEAWDTPAAVAAYIQGDELDLAFDFGLAQAAISSARTGRAAEVARVLSIDFQVFPGHQFATFLSNHDQNRVLSQLAGNVDKAKVAATMLLTFPGVPFIYYGEEIGMEGRKPDEDIRLPMQWSGEENAGFTTGRAWRSVNTSYTTANVAAEMTNSDSLLSHYRRLIHLRNDHAALRVGDEFIVTVDNPAIFSHLRASQKEAVLVVLNLGAETASGFHLSLESGLLKAGSCGALPILGDGPFEDVTVDRQGGFDSYLPAHDLPGYGAWIIQLECRQ